MVETCQLKNSVDGVGQLTARERVMIDRLSHQLKGAPQVMAAQPASFKDMYG
jgi:hypothetical protein